MNIKLLPILITLGSVICLAGAVSVTVNEVKSKPAGSPPSGSQHSKTTVKQPSLPKIAVVKVQNATYQAKINGYGEAQAHYQITYSSEISGRVKSLSSTFETGRMVKKGELLAQLEKTSYQQAVAQAKADLAQSKLDYLEEQRTGEQARLEWKRSGLEGEPSSDLVLRKPQLNVSKTALDNAQVSLLKAQMDLDKTAIKAPFDALIVSREIQPGSYLNTGSEIATLYSTDRVEIEIPLSSKQWQNLPEFNNQKLTGQQTSTWAVKLTDADGKNNWQGQVIRVQQHLNNSSRQRSLVVAVQQPFTQQLFPGTFVEAEISGRMLENTWKLPASAISQQGEVWFVNEDNKLDKATATELFSRGDNIYIQPVNELSSALVIKRPLSNYVVGMKIIPEQGV